MSGQKKDSELKWTIDLEELRTLPKEASQGLFVAFAKAGNQKVCKMLFPIIDFFESENPLVVDKKIVLAALNTFDSAAGWQEVIDKVNILFKNKWKKITGSERTRQNWEKNQVLDLSDFLIDTMKAGGKEKALILAKAEFADLAKRSGSGSGRSAEPLIWAIEKNDVELCEALAQRNDWGRALDKLWKGEYSSYNNFDDYVELGEDLSDVFMDEDVWEATPNALGALLCTMPWEELSPDLIFLALKQRESRQMLIEKQGKQGIVDQLLSQPDDYFVEHIAELAHHNDELAAQMILSAPNHKAALKRLTAHTYDRYHATYDQLVLLCAPEEKTRQAAWKVLGVNHVEKHLTKNYAQHPTSLLILEIMDLSTSCQDYRVLTEALRIIDFNKLSLGTSGRPILLQMIERADEKSLNLLLTALKEQPAVCAKWIAEEGWILEAEGLRKKGDALAAAVGLGKVELARVLLDFFPDFPKKRAKETLKYLKSKKNALEGPALSAFEQLIFDVVLGGLPKNKPSNPSILLAPARRRAL